MMVSSCAHDCECAQVVTMANMSLLQNVPNERRVVCNHHTPMLHTNLEVIKCNSISEFLGLEAVKAPPSLF